MRCKLCWSKWDRRCWNCNRPEICGNAEPLPLTLMFALFMPKYVMNCLFSWKSFLLPIDSLFSFFLFVCLNLFFSPSTKKKEKCGGWTQLIAKTCCKICYYFCLNAICQKAQLNTIWSLNWTVSGIEWRSVPCPFVLFYVEKFKHTVWLCKNYVFLLI